MSSLGGDGGWPNIPPGIVEIPLGRIFVWLPKRLHNGGWTWGFTHRRRVFKETQLIMGGRASLIHRVLSPLEYYTDEEATMLTLKGEQ